MPPKRPPPQDNTQDNNTPATRPANYQPSALLPASQHISPAGREKQHDTQVRLPYNTLNTLSPKT